MRDPKKFIDDYLAHEYDPVKAKEYYERTKKLKGRKKGQAEGSSGPPPKRFDSQGNEHPYYANKPKATQKPKAPASDVGKRAEVLKARLARLEEVLNMMQSKVKAAQARSGVESTSKKSAEPTKSSKKADTKESTKDKTSTEKKKDAKAAKERYEKNKEPETSKDTQAVQDEIEEVQKKIADVRAKLKDALAKARASSSKTETAKFEPSKTSKEGDRQNGT